MRPRGRLEAGDHILSLTWWNQGLVVTPSTGPILLAGADGVRLGELPDHGIGNGHSAAGGDALATCGFNGMIRIHDRSGLRNEIALGKGWIERVRWQGGRLAAGLGKTLYILDGAGNRIAEFSGHQTSVSDFAWNPRNNDEIAAVGGGGAWMWRLGQSGPFARLDWGGASLVAGWSNDGRWLVTGDQTPSVHLYDFSRDYPLHMQGFETKVKAFAFSPDSRRLAIGGGPMVTVWNCTGKTGPEGAVPRQLRSHKGDVEAIAWSPDGQLLATADITGRLVFSDPAGKPVSAFEGEETVSTLAWSPDGRHLAVGDAAGHVVVFEDA